MARPDAHVVFRKYLDAVGLYGQASAAAAGLHPTEWLALSALDLDGRMTSGDLAARCGLTTGAGTRLIDRLERAGHVQRLADPADRRRVLIERLPKSSVDVEEIVGPARRLVGEVFARYTPEQLETLFDYFAHAAPAFRQATEEIRGQAGR
jgi:DNA-binding MarR family transcriptional regulator